MGIKLSPQELELYRAIDEVLHYIWDPIGVSSYPQARDEYQGYVPGVYKLVMGGSDEQKIAEHLGEITTVRMELPENQEQNLHTAQVIIDWKNLIDERLS
jgi:hypothetical protein